MEGQIERSQELLSTRLYDAAIEGDLPSLHNLLQEDPLILDRLDVERSSGRCFARSPIHVAASLGRLEFAKAILSRKPELAEEHEQTRQSTALHMASGKGYLDIVRALLGVNPDTCLARDRDGRNPLHVAAIRGQIHVLDELLRARPQAAQERTNLGESVLHLSVKHGQLEALKYLMNVVDDGQLLNSRDSEGKTVLHIQSRKDPNDRVIWRSLKRAKALRAKDALKPRNKHRAWLDNQRNALMIVASLIATTAFQVGISPPGGAWQDNDNGHRAGYSIMADTHTGQYNRLLISNTISLVSSLSVIFLLISGLPCKQLFVGILMITMWVAISTTTLSYLISVDLLTSSKPHHVVWLTIRIALIAWLGLMVLLLLGHAMRLLFKLTRKLFWLVVRFCRCCCTGARRRAPV